MSAKVSGLPSPRLSPQASPAPVLNLNKTVDIEISSSLITIDTSRPSSPLSNKSDNMSSFQSAQDRLNRLNSSRPQETGGPNVTQGQRNSARNSWRRQTSNSSSSPAYEISEIGYEDVSMIGQGSLSHQGSSSAPSGEAVHISTVSPGPVWPTESQLKVAYAYGIRREDGSYTRLIRADELNDIDFSRVPVSQGPEGLITLPTPRLTHPERREGPPVFVSRETVGSLPLNPTRRPKISAHPAAGMPDTEDIMQQKIDNIIAAASIGDSVMSPPVSRSHRKQKIYCDKWIHEGVCAFTQLGCKYKHEMPMDKATQLSLGLNHGLPTWYKRAQAVQMRPESQSSSPTTPSQPRMSGSWRRPDYIATSNPGPSLGSGIARPTYGPNNFGPIAPPAPQLPHYDLSNNPYSMLQQDMKMDDDDEGEIVTWRGRHG